MTDLFNLSNKSASSQSIANSNDLSGKGNLQQNAELNSSEYTASSIEVLEGLEPVRHRPGMYIGGTDETAMHHLVSEVLDNSMDEAVAGHATHISITLSEDGSISIFDNGRGIPTDKHPKFPDKSALEVILTTLHSGGKFSGKAYQTSGGLHGVGISVVNALSSKLTVEVWRDGNHFIQHYEKGHPVSELAHNQCAKKLCGTKITFIADDQIFDENLKFKPKRIYELARSKAYLYKGVKINWQCPASLINSKDVETVPESAEISFPDGLKDYLKDQLEEKYIIGQEIFAGNAYIKQEEIKLEWAICWHEKDSLVKSYCNTIPTPLGGTHEQGMRAALLRSLKSYGEMTGLKKAQNISAEDILETVCVMLSVFIREPVFQGQTKEKLVSKSIAKPIENLLKDHFDHWLSTNKKAADLIILSVIANAEFRLSKKAEKLVSRKNATQRLRLPGKLADCTSSKAEGTELCIVEGESAGGSAKQARDRQTQAVLPLRGKILNVANTTGAKIAANQQIQDLEIALNCGSLKDYREENLRYEKIVIMTDADVDGAHIAALLMTFFYLRMPKLIENGHLYIVSPPLYRITQGTNSFYAIDDADKERIIKDLSQKSKAKIEIGRFKGLGEMTAKQLKETTMNKDKRIISQVTIDDFVDTDKMVDDLMGKNPEKRFKFIQQQTANDLAIVDKIII